MLVFAVAILTCSSVSTERQGKGSGSLTGTGSARKLKPKREPRLCSLKKKGKIKVSTYWLINVIASVQFI